MLAVDTNVVVRLLVGDDPDQSPRARAVVDNNKVWVATTVLLEAEWVLRRVYRYNRAAMSEAFRAFTGLPTVTMEHPGRVALALNWLDQGVDFADALHLAAAEGLDGFATFDSVLAKTAPADAAQIIAP